MPVVPVRRVPTPQECGLPEGFPAWRPGQEESLFNLLSNTKRVKVLAAETGFGKSAVIVAYALLTKLPTCIVTESRGLQDQYLADFAACGLVDLRGRRNYDCHWRPHATCEEGYVGGCPYKGSHACPSSAAEMRAATSWLVVTNYDKWTAAKKFGVGMQHFQQVIFDEAHSAPDALARAMQITLGAKEADDLGFDLLTDDAPFEDWKVWAQEARDEALTRYDRAKRAVKDNPHAPLARYREITHFRHLAKRLGVLALASPKYWVASGIEKGFQFDPIRPGRYGEAMLLMHVPSIVMCSATVRPKHLYQVGIGRDYFDFKEYASGFDPKRHPFYYIPTMTVNAQSYSLQPVWARHDQLAALRQDRKGLVQTVNYARVDDLSHYSRFSSQFITNTKGDPPQLALELFRASGPGTELVSPSFSTGYDFPLDQAEWQFIVKLPWPDTRSKIVQARQHDDPEWAPSQAMTKLQQMHGRIMRLHYDQGESFFPDDSIKWFLSRWERLASPLFLRKIKRTEHIPPPPPPLTRRR